MPRPWLAAAGLEPAAAEGALDELLRARLLRPAATARRFEFAHALVREAVYDELNVLRRARLHRQAAEALSGARRRRAPRGDRDAPLRGRGHRRRAARGRHAHAGRAARPGTARLRGRRRALRPRAQALELGGAQDDAGPVLLARGDALLRAGEPAAAREAFTAAAAIARAARTPTLLAQAALGFAGLGVAIVDVDALVVDRLEEALELTEDRCCARACWPGSPSSSTTPDRARSETLSAEAVATARARANRRRWRRR